MIEGVVQLHPLPAETRPLSGLYLSHNLRQHRQETFVYTNFVASLDGRIAIPDPAAPGEMMVPPPVANPRDWRLFQELGAQADIIITSGRYLRDYADGRAQEILELYDKPEFADLARWRQAQGLPPQPDLAVISGSLNFPVPAPLAANGRNVLIFTTAQADRQRIRALETQAGRVIIAGEKSVDGRILVQQMAQMGYRAIYSVTGPKVLHLLLAAGVLDRLYLTLAHRILGGRPFASIVEGALLQPPVDLTLHTLYYDAAGLDGAGQLFAAYNVV